jgi:uncharacterized membrane protein
VAAEIPVAQPAARPRNDAIDVLRGIVMVVMALDHARDFIGGFGTNPTDPTQTNYPLFFTRFITHFCAPVFVLLAGTAAYYKLRATLRAVADPATAHAQVARFLATRGLWLVILELTVVRTGWMLNVNYRFMVFQVIWAIGWSMVLLAILQWLPIPVVGAFGLVLILGHNLFDGVHADNLGSASWLWHVAHERGQLHPMPDHTIFLAYPLIPWVGVMAAGFALGRFITVDDMAQRKRRLYALGGALTIAFVILRATNLYGDPVPWTSQPRGPAYTFLSFLNCEKYPPSLCYLLMTLGPSLIALAALERPPGAIARFFRVFGRVPLFYYLLHLFVLHLVSFVFMAPSLIRDPAFRAKLLENGSPGWGLPMTYATWALAVLILYPICRRYSEYKLRSKSVWLSYL